MSRSQPLKSALKRMPIDGNNSISSKDSFLYDRIDLLGHPRELSLKKTSLEFSRPSLETKQQRKRSSIPLSHLFPRRKSLQTTAIAIRRQSLWMNLAKNGSAAVELSPSPSSPFLFSSLENEETDDFIRKKLLRCLLVVSYLISISLLAIALATFYGFFYSTGDLDPILPPRRNNRTKVSSSSPSAPRSLSSLFQGTFDRR